MHQNPIAKDDCPLPSEPLIGVERVEELGVSNSAAVSSYNCRYIKAM